ncbi:MAG: hypothetical protein AAF515_02925 [Pseudomonadota bacterium]
MIAAQPALAVLRALALALAGLVGLLALYFYTPPFVAKERVVVRQVESALAPPPPPPPAVREPPTNADMALDLLTSSDARLALPVSRVQAPELKLEALEPPAQPRETPLFDDLLAVNFDGFGLAELDGVPQLLTDLSIQFTARMLRAGIDRFKVELAVLIDESGRVRLRSIRSNEYPEMEDRIRSLIARARFSPPEKDGERVRARFVWPIEFRSNG